MDGHDGESTDPFAGLRSALEEGVAFPTVYVFKFIVPAASLNHLLALLDGLRTTRRESKTGRYVSVTVEAMMTSSEEVIGVYRRTSCVEGLMSL